VLSTKVTPAGVANLQRALPKCKIDWDDPAKATMPKLAYLDPAFQAWVNATQALPAEKQLEAVSKKLMELNPGFDGKLTDKDGKRAPKIDGGVVTELGVVTDNVADISPVRGFPGLRALICCGTSDGKGELSELSPLEGMNLTKLDCIRTQVSDLTPLQDMNLIYVAVTPQNITKGMDVIRQMKSLQNIRRDREQFPAAEFWKKYDAGEFGKPAAPSPQPSPARGEGEKPRLAYLDPELQVWVKATQALPAEQQIEAVSKKLMELNPGFDGVVTGADGKGTPKVENGAVTTFAFVAAAVNDISPVRALTKLQTLQIRAWPGSKSELRDLGPLAGMKLTSLMCGHTQVSDLSPLSGMRLQSLFCQNTPVSNLTPLLGMPLAYVDFNGTLVSDLSPLRDSRSLRSLLCSDTKVADLTPLKELPELWSIDVRNTKVNAAQVAALQMALPNCKIEWNGEGEGK